MPRSPEHRLGWTLRRMFVLALVVGGAACGGGGDGGGSARAGGAEPAARATPRPILTPVEVAPLARQTLVSRLVAAGTVLPAEEVTITSAGGGVVLEVLVDDGAEVAVGQVLAELDSSLDRITLRELQADLKAAEADRLSIDLDGALSRLERDKELLAEGLSSPERHERLAAEVRAARAQLLGVEARVERLGASIERINKQISEARLRSPIAGWISGRACHPGQRVSAGAPLMRVLCLDPVLVEIQVGERAIGQVAPGMAAELRVEAYPATTFDARVANIDPDADPASRTFAVRLEAANPGRQLRPGMFAEAKLPTQRRDNALVAPVDAVLRREGEVVVFVAEGEPAVAVRRPVIVGQRHGDVIEIIDGLEDGDMVVVAGNIELSDGERLYVIDADPTRGRGQDADGAAEADG